jgi:hypothetical protein
VDPTALGWLLACDAIAPVPPLTQRDAWQALGLPIYKEPAA